MTLNEYQEKALDTCTSSSFNFSYMMLNLVGEVGELSSKFAKGIRNEDFGITDDFISKRECIKGSMEENMMHEAGDILWQLSGLCSVMGWDLEDIATMNLKKLASRKKHNVIVGNGDNR